MDSTDADKEKAMKLRIIGHMNKDHAPSLSRFAQYYNKIPSSQTHDTQIANISLAHLILTCSGGRLHVPIDPPMTSLSEARGRLVAMDAEALEGLGLSSFEVKEYRPPHGFMAVVFAFCVATMVAFSKRSNFEAGSLFYEGLGLGYVPGFARFCWTIQPWLISSMVAIHVVEAGWMAKSRLRKYNVPLYSLLWWKWTASTFIEGFGGFKRLDALVGEMEAEKAKQKH